jgi:S1-C subfamily serine protease
LNRRYVASLAIAAALTLAAGFAVRQKLREAAPALPAVAPPSEASVFQQLSQEGYVRRLSSFLDERAARVAAFVEYVPATNASGVRWSSTEVLVTGSEDQPVEVVRTTSGGTARASPASDSVTGEWALVVARRPDGGVVSAAGVIGGRTNVECGGRESSEYVIGVPVSDAFAGGGVFDLAGRLLGVVVRCGGRVAALPTSEVRRLLADGDSLARRMLVRFGFASRPLDTLARSYFRADSGVLVTEVMLDGPADRAGMTPGDIVLQIDGVSSNDSVPAFPGERRATVDSHVVVVRRENSTRTWRLVIADRSTRGADARNGDLGIIIASPRARPGVVIGAVHRGSIADSAGLRAGDRLVRVDGVEVESAAAAQRLLRAARAGERRTQFIVFDRESARRGVLIQR